VKFADQITCIYEDARVIILADNPKLIPEDFSHLKVAEKRSPIFLQELLLAIGEMH